MKKYILVILLLCSLNAMSQTIPAYKITDVVKYYEKKNDSIYVINFWATFCKPCVEEIPYLISISKKYAVNDVKLLLVSLDLPSFFPDKIATYAAKNNFDASIVWLDETNADVLCPAIDSSWSGSIPATLIINNKTGYRKFFEEQIKPEVFEAELRKAIGIGN
jgi:thiol-disulfide isomerase/thioredoxin